MRPAYIRAAVYALELISMGFPAMSLTISSNRLIGAKRSLNASVNFFGAPFIHSSKFFGVLVFPTMPSMASNALPFGESGTPDNGTSVDMRGGVEGGGVSSSALGFGGATFFPAFITGCPFELTLSNAPSAAEVRLVGVPASISLIACSRAFINSSP